MLRQIDAHRKTYRLILDGDKDNRFSGMKADEKWDSGDEIVGRCKSGHFSSIHKTDRGGNNGDRQNRDGGDLTWNAGRDSINGEFPIPASDELN